MNFLEQEKIPRLGDEVRQKGKVCLGKDASKEQEEIPIGILEVTAGEKDLKEEKEEK
ncbi:MAG: hypothetical protein PHU71_05770 [Candidatus Gracilibacteria bacterium]|nr:hypothetical protein [Candidatus Gracilibacteria bacterium]